MTSKPPTSTFKLWHDDTRPPPDSSWIWTRTNAAAIEQLLTVDVVEASLDHDLEYALVDVDVIQRVDDEDDFFLVDLLTDEDTCHDTGLELVAWMIAHDRVPAIVRVHSWNPDGAAAMAAVLQPHTVLEVREWSPDDAPS